MLERLWIADCGLQIRDLNVERGSKHTTNLVREKTCQIE
jgi:hypothetical protein